MPDAAETREFGHYLIRRELGRGAQGIVYLAEDVRLHREVALKTLTAAGAMSKPVRDRFQREALLTSRLEHPGICGVHEIGEVAGVPYIAMQYVRGNTLAQIIHSARSKSATVPDVSDWDATETAAVTGSQGKSHLQDVVSMIERAARALHVAHDAGLVHRDIKPGNIMVTPQGLPVLLDFGLARDVDEEGATLTQTGQIMGTPAYLSREQIVAKRGTIDRRTDVYALGVTLFECVTLRRPFDAETWDQLFHQILHSEPPNPRKLNPRIPRDLCTVIDVAMQRDAAKRYPSAEAFADDLRRVLAFEPIQAKAAGPIGRVQKWARRNPGLATTTGVIALLVLAGTTTFVVRAVQQSRELRGHVARARSALRAADFTSASVEIRLAQTLAPKSAEVIDLTSRIERGREEAEREASRQHDLAAAADARAEAVELQTRYAQTRQRIDERSAELLREQSGVFTRYATDDERGEFARKERELRALTIEAERSLLAVEEALQRAASYEAPWGGTSAETEETLAGFYIARWRDALTHKDEARAEVMRAAVEQHDPQGRHRDELLGRGTLTLNVTPPRAELYLFRYESNDDVREGAVIPRLVPLPTAGVGRAGPASWGEDFRPGDLSLCIASVAPDSLAAQAGLQRGDLVLRVQGIACGTAVFVRELRADSSLARAGVERGTAVLEIDGAPVTSVFDWATNPAQRDGLPHRVKLSGFGELECAPRDIACISAADLIESAAPIALQLSCLRGGEPRTFNVPAGSLVGMHCEPTAYPLICAPENRVAAASALTVDPGSYLVLARCDGFDDQRFAVFVDRLGAVRARIELLPAGSTPSGFVYVPPGAFIAGGDPNAFKPREAETSELDGFFIARMELTNRDWYEFVNDPETLAKIATAKFGTYLPRDDKLLARKDADGTFAPDVFDFTSPYSPVLGLAWTDVHDYVEWRNRKAAQANEPWRYDLPTEAQWEKAARGVDGRLFPWGNRFDPALTVCAVRKGGYLLDAPGGYEPRDESPYGVLDMAGSREEWVADAVEGRTPPVYRKHGGQWGSFSEIVFRAASRGEASQDRFASAQGFRLVLRKP